MAHGKPLDVLDSGCDEFGARERAKNRPTAGPAGHARRCAGRAKGDAAQSLPRAVMEHSHGGTRRPQERLITARGKLWAASPFARPAQRRACPSGPAIGRFPARSRAPNSSRTLSSMSRRLPWAIGRTKLCRVTPAASCARCNSRQTSRRPVRPRALDAPKAREMRQVVPTCPVPQQHLLLERARALQVHRSRHLGKLGHALPRAARDRPRSAPRPTLIADLYFTAALASCAGARLTARHGASSRGIRPESKPASCGCEYLSSQAGATWGTIKAISVQFAAAFAARSSQIELSRFEPAPIGGSWRWGWCALENSVMSKLLQFTEGAGRTVHGAPLRAGHRLARRGRRHRHNRGGGIRRDGDGDRGGRQAVRRRPEHNRRQRLRRLDNFRQRARVGIDLVQAPAVPSWRRAVLCHLDNHPGQAVVARMPRRLVRLVARRVAVVARLRAASPTSAAREQPSVPACPSALPLRALCTEQSRSEAEPGGRARPPKARVTQRFPVF
eukprot:COSAG04_NODE_92_length_26689_cov_12.755434_11_plen_501_part_00